MSPRDTLENQPENPLDVLATIAGNQPRATIQHMEDYGVRGRRNELAENVSPQREQHIANKRRELSDDVWARFDSLVSATAEKAAEVKSNDDLALEILRKNMSSKRLSNKYPDITVVDPYTPEEKKIRIQRWREKRERMRARIVGKEKSNTRPELSILRRKFANERPRVSGKFIPKSAAQKALDAQIKEGKIAEKARVKAEKKREKQIEIDRVKAEIREAKLTKADNEAKVIENSKVTVFLPPLGKPHSFFRKYSVFTSQSNNNSITKVNLPYTNTLFGSNTSNKNGVSSYTSETPSSADDAFSAFEQFISSIGSSSSSGRPDWLAPLDTFCSNYPHLNNNEKLNQIKAIKDQVTFQTLPINDFTKNEIIRMLDKIENSINKFGFGNRG